MPTRGNGPDDLKREPTRPTPDGSPRRRSEGTTGPSPYETDVETDDVWVQVTRSTRIAALKADSSGCTFTTATSASHPPRTFRLDVDAPNYNAQYSMLLAASMSGCVVDVAGHEAGETCAVDSLQVKWSESSITWETVPNTAR